jgi:hypothetical protein
MYIILHIPSEQYVYSGKNRKATFNTELACQEWIKSIVYTYSQSPCWIYENVDIGQVTNENEFEIIRIEDNV